jgi:hypothetical protein
VSEQVDGASLFLFAKIEAEIKQLAQQQVYGIVSGPNEYLILYRAEGVIAPSFMTFAGNIQPKCTCWKDHTHACTKTSTVSVSRCRYGSCNVGC